MQPLFQSTFLQALGFAIANSLWQTALVWLLCTAVNGLLPLSSAAKHRLAVIAQLGSFVWFMVTFQFYYSQYNEAWQQSAAVPAAQDVQAVLSGSNGNLINWMVKAEQFLPYVSMAYLLLMVFLCVRWLLGYRQTQLIRNQGLQKMPVDWRLFVKKISAQMGIKKDIALFLSETISTPMTIGFLKPVILIPVASINHLTTQQLEAVLLHELAHIKRYDYLVNIILSVVEISLFFNPFTQLLSKSIRKERENSCDDWVLQFQYNASVYAEALLRIAYLQSAPAFAMAATGKKNDLLVRVKRMIDKKENRFSYRKQLLAFLIVTGMLSSIAWLNPIATAHAEQPGSPVSQTVATKNIPVFMVEPMAVSVDNPWFNPVFFLSAPLKAEIQKNLASAQKEVEALMPAGSHEKTSFFAGIPPLVANALEQASVEIQENGRRLEKDIANLEFEKIRIENTFLFDTASLLQHFKGPWKEEMTRSLKNIDADIENAKKEMRRTDRLKVDFHVDAEKIRKDIALATAEISKLQLDKLVDAALQIPGNLLEFNTAAGLLKKIAARPKKGGGTNPPPTPARSPEPEKVILDDETETAETKETAEHIPVGVDLDLASLSAITRITPEIAAMLKAKAQMLQELVKLQPKIIPAVAREKRKNDERMVIRLQ